MDAVLHALRLVGAMTWEILWALILGFVLSAVVQAVVRRATVVRLLGDARPGTLAKAAGFGAASSSCSYAAVALARSLYVKGADFTAAMAFEVASTNLVVELGIIQKPEDEVVQSKIALLDRKIDRRLKLQHIPEIKKEIDGLYALKRQMKESFEAMLTESKTKSKSKSKGA